MANGIRTAMVTLRPDMMLAAPVLSSGLDLFLNILSSFQIEP
jgi:hypothetical protein